MSCIRWNYVAPRLAALAFLAVAVQFGLPPVVRWSLSTSGQAATGAKVEVGQVECSLLESKIELHDLAVADPDKPLSPRELGLRNLFGGCRGKIDTRRCNTMKPSLYLRLFCLLVAALAAQVVVADPPVKITSGPLAGVPSKPGPHLERIKAMGDNSWLELGIPAADPKWGRARGRSWTSEMPMAPELRGAFLYGEGVHGYTKPDGRYMDDLWFYDINAHRWTCCYPGADTRSLKLKINPDGFEADDSGKLVPVAQQVHGYEMNTYDTDRGRLLSMPNTHPYWESDLAMRKEWLKPPPRDASPWSFDPATGEWLRRRTGAPGPQSSYGDTLIYLPGRKQAFFLHRNSDVWLYDIEENKWTRVEPKGPPPPFGIDAVSCLDTKRERIHIGGGSYPITAAGKNAFWTYDLKSNTWIDLRPKGAPCRGSTSYPTKNALLAYDSHADRVLLVFHSHFDDQPERLGIYVYDPAANAWAEEPLSLPDKLGRNSQPKNGFYDAKLGVVFVHSAPDSGDEGTIWAYRYKAKDNGLRTTDE